MAKDCAGIKADITNLEQMAKIFLHPLSLIYHVGKNLIVNGVDIFHKMQSAISSKRQGDYFNYGKFVGEALAEIFLGAETKTDE